MNFIIRPHNIVDHVYIMCRLEIAHTGCTIPVQNKLFFLLIEFYILVFLIRHAVRGAAFSVSAGQASVCVCECPHQCIPSVAGLACVLTRLRVFMELGSVPLAFCSTVPLPPYLPTTFR